MRRYISTLAGMALIVLVGILAGCTQSPIGLFESIELERKIFDDRELDNELAIGSIAESGDRYFIAAATLWYRDVADANYEAGDVAQWVYVASPGTPNFTTSSLVTFGGSVYAAYSSQDGTEGGVYAVNPAADSIEVTTTAVFGTELDADVAGVGKVLVANDGAERLLIVVKKSGVTSRYSVYESTTGGAPFAEVVGTERNLPVIDVAENAAGAVAFLTRKSILIDSDGLNNLIDPADVTANLGIVDRQPEFGGVYYHPDSGTLWVTDNDGFLYRSVDFGTTWTANATAHLVGTDESDPLQFTDMTAVNNGGTQLLVVGTEGHGYRELDATFIPTSPAAEVSNYQASELAQATILAFYVDEGVTVYVPAQSGDTYEEKTGDLLFAGTSNLGLWKALYGGDPPQWVRE